MKKALLKSMLVALLSICTLSASAATLTSDDKPIQYSQLPKAAQLFVKKHFADRKVAVTKMDKDLFDRDYTVIFSTGEKIEFDGNGKWTDISNPNSAVVAKFVPAPITKYVNANFKNASITEIERDKKGYEVKLNNGREIKFNKKFQVTDIDD